MKTLDLQLPDDFIDRAMALAGQPNLWRERGAFVAEFTNGIRRGAGKMIVYQKCADIWRLKAISTVTEDLRFSRIFGDFADEMPFDIGRDDCRCAISEARVRNVDPLVVMRERANQSDEYGGQLCPPRKWREQIKDMENGKKQDDGEDVLGRLRAAYSAVTTAIKRANGKTAFASVLADIESAGCVLADLVDKAEGATQ